MLTRLDHVAIAVRDLETAQRDYTRLLGRTPSWQESNPADGARAVRFELRNTAITLVEAVGTGSAAVDLQQHLNEHGEGIHALALATDDLDAARAALCEDGLRLGEPAAGISQDGPSGAFRRFRSVDLPIEATGGIRLQIREEKTPAEEIPPSLPLADESACVQALDHVVVMTKDADRARSLYGDRLGIRLALDKTFEDRGARILFFRIGGATIEVGASATPPDEAREDAADHLWGLAFQVPDADAAHARLHDAGFELGGVRDGFKPGTRVATVKGGTHGVAMLLIEPVAR